MEHYNSKPLKLIYHTETPDSYDGWEKWSLPLGNGGIGASIFGGIARERIQLNEKSLWSGGPSSRRPDYQGGNLPEKGRNGKTLHEIQNLFLSGKVDKARKLCDELTGLFDEEGAYGYGFFLSYANMYLDFPQPDPSHVTNYTRSLNLDTALCSISFDCDGVHYTRESFISYPDNVLVTKLSSDHPDGLDVNVSVIPDNTPGNSCCPIAPIAYQRHWKTSVENGCISINGTLDDNDLKFCSHTQILTEEGECLSLPEYVSVKRAKSVFLITSIGTDYKNNYPVYRTGETSAWLEARILSYVSRAAAFVRHASYEELKLRHVTDYSNLFHRVRLNLEKQSTSCHEIYTAQGEKAWELSTDTLLEAYRHHLAPDDAQRYLETLLFQYGRYLTIASSRETPPDDPYRETLPSNLQGIWAGANNSIWHADYHLNVNLQMNYWPVYNTNLAECGKPLIRYTDSLRAPGRVTAAIYSGITSTETHPENGFMAHTQNTPYGWTCPGWIFDWGWSPAVVPWLLQNCWEYYEYTNDIEYLRECIYPMMKEEAILYDQLLVEDSDGHLISAPSFSPEHGPRTAGNTYEHTLIWQLYHNVIRAARILKTDDALIAVWKDHMKRLKGPIEIGSDGQIKEWYEETLVNTLGQGFEHRHISHLLGVYPGTLISLDTPELLKAAEISMNCRTDESTGWGMGQRINTWARLHNGNRAHKLITDLLKTGIMTNLWDTHPPFQIDGNFALTAGVAEMLLQSHLDCIDLLPALPDAWKCGQVSGLVARGNLHISMCWEKGRLQEATIFSTNGGPVLLRVPDGYSLYVSRQDQQPVPVFSAGNGKEGFQSESGISYCCRFLGR